MSKTLTKITERPLTMSMQVFVNMITDGFNQETYNNVKRSYMAAYPRSSEKAAESNGIRLIRKDRIVEAIANKVQEIQAENIANREQRQRFWTRGMLGLVAGFNASDRLRASELLGRSQADFTDKLQHTYGGIVPPDIDPAQAIADSKAMIKQVNSKQIETKNNAKP